MEMETSPPALRMVLMTPATAVSEETGAVPSQAGLQPLPPARMKASSKAFCPVAAITVARLGGLLSSGITYGAEPYQLLVSVAACASGVTAKAMVAAATVVPAATAAPMSVDLCTSSSCFKVKKLYR